MGTYSDNPDEPKNLLPFDGEVFYFGKILSPAGADLLFQIFKRDIEWRRDEVVIFGKKHITKREVAWYGDEPFEYNYSNSTKKALAWTEELRQMKKLTESITHESFNSCLLNLYHDGNEAMGWHSDDEKQLKKNGAIASLSFGAERKFSFKHRISGTKIELMLEHGSLLLMKGKTQESWMHRLPPSKKITQPRINLTFRTIVGQ